MSTGVLGGIRSPADLRGLDGDRLDQLAADIRRVLIDTVAANGGHLGSNLGAVELTIALHRVLDSPTDAIVWDTGHQAYTHKLLTGRRARFPTLRRARGLTGYPNRAESPHDWVENSHASTALSYAYGLAAARRHAGHAGRVVAVVGDGALTGGMAYEGLNNIGWRGLPVVVVLNDNGRSYAPTVSRLSEALSPLRVAGRRAGDAGEADEAGAEGGDAAPSGPSFFAALGVDYRGPLDGHDVAALESGIRDALASGRPAVVHVLTRKGRGFPPAEDDDDKCLHDVAPFRPQRYAPPARSRPRYTDVFSEALVRAAARDPRIVAITAAMPSSTGLRPFAEAFPDRFFDVGIAEQHAVTAAAGMAMGGLRPVVAIYSSFLTRALDQVNLDVGLHRLPVVLCVDRAGITGPDGPSHHGVLDLALLGRVPGMTVFAPSSGHELEVMLTEALAINGPCALRWPSGTAREVAPGGGRVGAGRRARRLRAGRDVCLVAAGPLVEAADEAAGLLEDVGVSTTVWDMRLVKPVDDQLVADAGRHRLVVTVEDGFREGGAGARVVDALGRSALVRGGSGEGDAAPPVVVLGVPDSYVAHGDPAAIRSELGLDGIGIAAAARDGLRRIDRRTEFGDLSRASAML
ncbi:MAG TPA: 1-deoxy-D-xylulose-5-phosphate synthase [Acidimicrobiales bacterium]|nr:1-deoxy-D-xylulose-5-phosphate synthase [Acidimicrobiales bacterium]